MAESSDRESNGNGGLAGSVAAQSEPPAVACPTKFPVLLFLTNDADFQCVARAASEAMGYSFLLGDSPEDGTKLLAQSLDRIRTVIMDLDDCQHGTAWLAALASASRKIPAIAASRLDPQFLQPIARRHGVEYWITKPVRVDQLEDAIRQLCQAETLGCDGNDCKTTGV